MFDEHIFDKEIDSLIEEGQEKKAEERMLKEYSALKAIGSVKELGYVIFRLAHYYAMPDTENLEKAEAYFLENEALSPGPYTKCKTTWFYFYVLADPRKTIQKVDEIRLREADRDSYYSALAMKAHAQLNLRMIGEASKTLEELLDLIKRNPRGLPYGDEMNLLEAAMSNPVLASRCREILELIIPKIRSKEYQERAKALLQS